MKIGFSCDGASSKITRIGAERHAQVTGKRKRTGYSGGGPGSANRFERENDIAPTLTLGTLIHDLVGPVNLRVHIGVYVQVTIYYNAEQVN